MNYLSTIVEKFHGLSVLVIGDPMIDQYHFGTVDRVSPEAPVPIFVENYHAAETRRGGADNVAHQLEVLGCQVTTLFPDKRSVKHRYFVGHHHIFRRDSDSIEAPHAMAYEDAYVLCRKASVVVLSDYAKGFLTEKMCRIAIESGKPVVVDPKGSDWSKYNGAYVICPNHKEWYQHDREKFKSERVILKRGAEGLQVFDGNPVEGIRIQARTRSVFDVTGAGDCVVALVAATLGVGGSLIDGAMLASHAAGEVVSKIGTAVCSEEELLKSLFTSV